MLVDPSSVALSAKGLGGMREAKTPSTQHLDQMLAICQSNDTNLALDHPNTARNKIGADPSAVTVNLN